EFPDVVEIAMVGCAGALPTDDVDRAVEHHGGVLLARRQLGGGVHQLPGYAVAGGVEVAEQAGAVASPDDVDFAVEDDGGVVGAGGENASGRSQSPRHAVGGAED